ncbi:MAG: hypothetical protein LBN18_05560 [Dysgonamonadaceae bacterium]|jgi:ligand-binding sensor domain-containing protein/signal transduction histidine kinase|nr:hypothetical protein [Dysgonamonadaceae bacterium]
MVKVKNKSRRIASWLIILIQLFLPALLFAQNSFLQKNDPYTAFRNISTKNGLSSNLVLNILQDCYNVMWFATDNGLTRYDGSVFTVYRRQSETDGSVSDNFITALSEDCYGNLWIGTQNGLNRYNRQTNDFTRYFAQAKDTNSLKNNYIKALYSDRQGYLWCETQGGFLSRFDVKNSRWIHGKHSARINEGDYYYCQIFEDSKHNLWIGGRNEIPTLVPNKNMDKIAELIDKNLVDFYEAACYIETLQGDLLWSNYPGLLLKYDMGQQKAEIVTRLPFSATSAICDEKGEIWLGGAFGIMHLNLQNKEITRLQQNVFNPNSLISNHIYCLYKDRSNRIWIGTDKGLSLYSEKGNVFRHYRHFNGQENGLSSDEITAVMQDKDDLIWVGTAEHGVDTFSMKTEYFGNLRYRLLQHDLDRATFEREKKTLAQYFRHQFITTEKPAEESAIFDHYDHFRQTPLHFPSINENKVSVLYQDQKGKIYVGLWSHVGFNIYDKKAKIFKRWALWSKAADNSYPRLFEGNPFGANWYAGFLEDNQNRFWCATWEAFGLNLFDREKSEFLPKHYIPGNYPCKNTVFRLAYDPHRQRMFLGGGFYYGYYDSCTQTFVRYGGRLPRDYPNKAIFDGYFQYCKAKWANIPVDFKCVDICLQDSVVWIQTGSAVIKHHLNTDQFEHFPENFAPKIPWEKKGKFTDQSGKIWIPTDDGLKMLDPKTGQTTVNPFLSANLKVYRHDPKDRFSLLDNQVFSVCEDGNADLWVSTAAGLCIWERKTGHFIDKSVPDEHTLTSRLTSCLIQDQSENIWIGTTENGISVLNPKTDRFTHFIHHNWDETGLSDNFIYCIFEGSKGVIWIGTNKGLNKYCPQTSDFETILPEYKIRSIQEDRAGNLWLASDDGLWVVNDSGKIVRHIADFPGLQDKDFGKAGRRLSDGRLAFGGNYGLNIFDPQKIMNGFEPQPVVFSHFALKDSVRYFDLNEREKINLKYHENSFSVHFSSTDYEFIDLIRYRYRLQGFDDTWTYTSAPALTASYTNLPSGNYVFIAESSDCFGEWSDNIQTLKIHIATPWYRQIWFLITGMLLVIGIIIAIIRLREKQLKQTNLRLEAIVEKRTGELRAMNDSKNRFFGIISHDLRNPLKSLHLTTNALYEQYDQLSDEEKYNLIRIIHETTGQTSSMLEDLLLWVVSQMGLLKANLQKTNLKEITTQTLDFLKHTAQIKNITFVNLIPENQFVAADTNLLSTVLRNLITNAIHFSFPGGNITLQSNDLSVLSSSSAVDFSITDQGPGISEENQKRLFRLDTKVQTQGTAGEQGSGLGLIITKEFLHLQGGTIRVESEPGKGCCFIVTLNKFLDGNAQLD